MKTAVTCTGRAPPELRQTAEEVLTDGETLSGFIARDLASSDAALTSRHYVKTSTVLTKLEQHPKKNAHEKAAIAK